jgi:hypothetical protein
MRIVCQEDFLQPELEFPKVNTSFPLPDLPNQPRDCYQILGEDEASLGDAILPSSHKELGFQPKSFNRRPNPEFVGSRSNTKMHKTSIHDPHKEIKPEHLIIEGKIHA